jgi:hypothetical protein
MNTKQLPSIDWGDIREQEADSGGYKLERGAIMRAYWRGFTVASVAIGSVGIIAYTLLTYYA